ncbi:hypothetical protein [Bradyrhizobium sp. SZCCHNS2096]|uniref:hypothetical protein n=1 Tax=Bradyrhizobium sp. SZCCHNS2096 TaxID=3057309 RepID=UPI0029162053|nr:hypothetical protein [Bradyrhizobium sp. SZCCHNS2096]
MKIDHDASVSPASAARDLPNPIITRRSMLRIQPDAFELDAELLALGRRFDDLRARYFISLERSRRRNHESSERQDDLLAARVQKVDALVREAVTVPARTVAGLKLKARMAEWQSNNLDARKALKSAEFVRDRILWSLVCDLVDRPAERTQPIAV